MNPRVTITDARGAEALLESNRCAEFHALISIISPNEEELVYPKGWVEFGTHEDRVKHLMVVNDVLFPDLKGAATERDVREVLGLFPRIEGTLLVHCSAGWSRSPAVALLYIAWALGHGHEREAVNTLFTAYPRTMPNTLIVALGDRLLGRKRKLFDALLRHTKKDKDPVEQGIYDGLRYDELSEGSR